MGRYRCDLCDDRVGAYVRNHGFNVCDACRRADYEGRLSHWGAWVTHRTRRFRDGARGHLHQVEVKGELESAPDVHARFTREHVGHALIKLFQREPQAGEPTFDARVYVDCGEPERMEPLLTHPTLQSAVLYIIGVGGELTIEGDRIVTRLVSESLPEEKELALATACVMRVLSGRAPARPASGP